MRRGRYRVQCYLVWVWHLQKGARGGLDGDESLAAKVRQPPDVVVRDEGKVLARFGVCEVCEHILHAANVFVDEHLLAHQLLQFLLEEGHLLTHVVHGAHPAAPARGGMGNAGGGR